MGERRSAGIDRGRRRLVRLGGAALLTAGAGCTDRGGEGGNGTAGNDDESRPPMAVVAASVDETTVFTDETLEVTGRVENRGDRAGTFYAELRMDEVIVDTTGVTVAAGETEPVTFTGTFSEPGEYEVSINETHAGTVRVELPPPEFEVREATVDRSTIAIGESVEVTATVANVGGREGTFTAELRVDGLSVETRETAIDAGTEETVAFSHTFTGPGEYEVSLNETPVETVRVVPPAEFEVTAATVDRTTIEIGESVEVTATVANVGNLEGATAVELERNGRPIESREVTLAPAETTTVRFSVGFEQPGAYELGVGGTSAGTVYARECTIAVSETVTVESRSASTYEFDLKGNVEIRIAATTREGVDPTLTVLGPAGDPLVDGTTDGSIRGTATTRAAGPHEIRLDNEAFLPWQSGTWDVEIEICRW